MRQEFVFALAFIAFTIPVARAQGVAGIDVTEYGVYTADEEKSSERSSNGVLRNNLTHIRHAATTTTVQAEHGVHFGIRYHIVGSPVGQTVQIKKVTIYPPGGVKSPKSSTPLERSEYMLTRKIGETSYTDYSFDDPCELVPGSWTIQLWVGERKLVEKQFTVVDK